MAVAAGKPASNGAPLSASHSDSYFGPDLPTPPDEIVRRTCQGLVLGYLSGFGLSFVPRLGGLVIQAVLRPKKGDRPPRPLVSAIVELLGKSAKGDGAAFLATLMGGLRAFEGLGEWMAHGWTKFRRQDEAAKARFVSTVAAAWLAAFLAIRRVGDYGRRTDIMLLAAVRAGDVFLRGVVAAPQRHGHRSRDGHGHRHHTLTSLLLENADTLVFVGSCWAVMWCWFYEPRALPRSYNNWISRMSELHPSLHRGLRYIREGKLHYGKESPHNHLLFEVADGYGMPRHMGDIASFGPSNPHGFQQIPCLLVHKGLTDSCPGHWKNVWTNGFKRSILIYLPIHVIARIVSIGTRPKGSPRVNLLEVARRTAEDVVLSTSFLSTFITLVWMPICTLRSHVFRPGFADTVGYGPGLGSFLSGFSILLERKSRRRELALFVLPRALYALGYMLLGSARIATGGKRDPKHGRQIMRAGERLLVDAVAWPLAVAILVSCLRYGESRFYGRSSWVKLLVTFVAGRNRRGALGKGEQDGHNGSHTQSVAPK